MKSLLNKVERLADSASLFAANLSSIILLLLVVLTVIDVIGRYFFSSPLVGAVELVRICMAGIIFFSVPYMFLRSDHIVVDLLPMFRDGKLARVTRLLFLLTTMVITIYLGMRVFGYAVRAFEDGDTTEYLFLPRWPVVGLITAAIFSATLMSAIRFLQLLTDPTSMKDSNEGVAK